MIATELVYISKVFFNSHYLSFKDCVGNIFYFNSKEIDIEVKKGDVLYIIGDIVKRSKYGIHLENIEWKIKSSIEKKQETELLVYVKTLIDEYDILPLSEENMDFAINALDSAFNVIRDEIS